MGKKSVSKLALMSIHPKYADAIFEGTKKVEFRKKRLDQSVTHVIIYATAPISSIVGAFEIKTQQILTPSALWKKYREIGGIDSRDFFSYFEGYESGVAIEISKVQKNKFPVSLQELGEIRTAPQSFQYLDASYLRKITELSKKVA